MTYGIQFQHRCLYTLLSIQRMWYFRTDPRSLLPVLVPVHIQGGRTDLYIYIREYNTDVLRYIHTINHAQICTGIIRAPSTRGVLLAACVFELGIHGTITELQRNIHALELPTTMALARAAGAAARAFILRHSCAQDAAYPTIQLRLRNSPKENICHRRHFCTAVCS